MMSSKFPVKSENSVELILQEKLNKLSLILLLNNTFLKYIRYSNITYILAVPPNLLQ